MIKKAIILAGGLGTRLSPITKSINKHLLPINDKPLIFYPLSILMLTNIKDFLIIVNSGTTNQFRKLLGDGSRFGTRIKYAEQKKPIGVPDAFNIGEKFIGKDSVALILGDNFFYGQSLSSQLLKASKLKTGAKIFLQPVGKPESFGIAKVKNQKVIAIQEKPKKSKSNLAITGLYFFDNTVIKKTKKLKKSKRNELEIVDLLNLYKRENKLNAEFLGRGAAWLDAGTLADFLETSNFVNLIEKRQDLKIACLEEIAFNKAWIDKNNIKNSINFYGKCQYSDYLKKLL
jgi:glucose-1-phosphate thymidylyltransferase